VISVVIPTVDGRQEHYERCFNAYCNTLEPWPGSPLEGEYEIQTVANRETCGIAWQIGADRSIGEYLHFTADDLEPHRGWAEAAVAAISEGFIPMPTIYGPDGSVEPLGAATAGCTRIPFCSSEMWEAIGPMLPIHYYTDNYFSIRAMRAGIELREVPEYAFTHHWAEARRGAGMSQQERMLHDRREFERAIA
jgi:hypothetical protein